MAGLPVGRVSCSDCLLAGRSPSDRIAGMSMSCAHRRGLERPGARPRLDSGPGDRPSGHPWGRIIHCPWIFRTRLRCTCRAYLFYWRWKARDSFWRSLVGVAYGHGQGVPEEPTVFAD